MKDKMQQKSEGTGKKNEYSCQCDDEWVAIIFRLRHVLGIVFGQVEGAGQGQYLSKVYDSKSGSCFFFTLHSWGSRTTLNLSISA